VSTIPPTYILPSVISIIITVSEIYRRPPEYNVRTLLRCKITISLRYRDGRVSFLSYFPRRVKSTFRPEVGFGGAGYRSCPVVIAAAADKTAACPIVHAKMSFRKSIAARTGGPALSPPPPASLGALVQQPRVASIVTFVDDITVYAFHDREQRRQQLCRNVCYP